MRNSSMNKAIFLDRDGVLVVPHFREGRSFAVRSLKEFRLYPESYEALSLLKKAGFILIVVTNQPDIGAKIIAQDTVDQMHTILARDLPIDHISVCPHTKEQSCRCRKPLPGLLNKAATDLGIDLARSYMVGDRASDVEAGQRVGCQTIFIDLGYTSEVKPISASFSCKNVLDAAHWIIKQEEK